MWAICGVLGLAMEVACVKHEDMQKNFLGKLQFVENLMAIDFPEEYVLSL